MTTARKGVFRKCYGRGKFSEKWYVSFRDHLGVWRRTPAFSTRETSAEYRRRIHQLADLRAQDLPLPLDVQRWAQALPSEYVERLVKFGLLEKRWLASGESIDAHLHEWACALEERGRTPGHVELYVSRVKRVLAAASIDRWAKATPESLEEAWLGLRRNGKLLHPGTLNHYRTALVAFGRWMKRTGRAASNPAEALHPRRVTERRERRPLTPEEVEWLLRTADASSPRSKARRDGGFHYDITGPERATLYQFAIETGLRSGEIAKLRVCDFDLTHKYPTVTVPDRVAKSRKRTPPIPLRPELVERLRASFVGKHPDAPALNTPGKLNAADVLRADMAEARTAWIAAGSTAEERHARADTDTFKPVDARGAVVDFHALRTTTANWLAAAGVSPYAMQQLMRHSDLATTMAHYVKANPEAARAALAQMPDLRLADGGATG